jgi:hypothetical protein
MAINSSPTRVGTIAGKEIKRTAEKMLWVKSPDGEVVLINQSNAFDLVNHNKWSWHKPKAAEAPEAPVEAEAKPAEAKTVETPKDEEPKEPSPLDVLRAEATALGIPVDARWGVRTLKEKIEEAKDEAPAADAEEADEA